MADKTVLILGGGWGGLTAAHHLRELLGSQHRIVVVERRDKFSLNVSNMWLMTGERDDVDQIERSMGTLKREGIEWVEAEAQSFDPVNRVLSTDEGEVIGEFIEARSSFE